LQNAGIAGKFVFGLVSVVSAWCSAKAYRIPSYYINLFWDVVAGFVQFERFDHLYWGVRVYLSYMR
jgi:hypothetical protein